MPSIDEIRRFFGKAPTTGSGSTDSAAKDAATRAAEDRSRHKRSAGKGGAKGRERTITAFVDRLKAAVAEGPAPVASTVQMLTLDGLKDHFGDRWERMAERIHSIIRTTIERNQTDRDTYTCYQDQAYVMLFAGIDAEGATLKTALIAEEISRRLFGDMPDGSLMRVGLAKLDGGDIAQLEMRDPREIVEAVFRKTTRAGNVLNLQPRLPIDQVADNRPAGDDSGPSGTRARHRDGPRWVPNLRASIADGVLSPEAVTDWGATGQMVAGAGAATEAPNNWMPLDAELQTTPQAVRFLYAPAWLVKREMIAAQTCIPARILDDGSIVQGGGAMPSRRAAPVNFSLDILALRKVAEDLEQQAKDGVTCLVVLPVHIQTLAHGRFRLPFLAAFAAVPDSVRTQIMVEIMGVTEATPSSTLAGVVTRLTPLCRRLLIRTRLETRTLAHLGFPEIQAVGVDLSALPYGEREIFRGMETFNALARSHGKRTFVHGLRTRSLLSAAAAAGFWYLDGAIISAAQFEPEPAKRWTIADVYASLF